jgi:hypothetical protein
MDLSFFTRRHKQPLTIAKASSFQQSRSEIRSKIQSKPFTSANACPGFVFNMLATSLLSFIVATMAASSLASPLSNTEADVENVDPIPPSAGGDDLFANFFCRAPTSTYACEEYCDCTCSGSRVTCFGNPTTCPSSVQATCQVNCACATK